MSTEIKCEHKDGGIYSVWDDVYRCKDCGENLEIPFAKPVDNPQQETLLPCPFCGGKPEWINLAHPSGIPALQCPECQFSIQQDRRDKTIFYWQRRNSPSTPQISDEDKECAKWCGMNYCDENGCVNRKRHLVDIEPTEKPDSEWLTEKPAFNKECLFIAAWEIKDDYLYNFFRTIKVTTEDGDYLGLFDGDGEEWGELKNLQADRYKIISPIN